jgi:hypothetical protein
LLFVPGSQAFRTPIRALPYVASLMILAWCWNANVLVRPLPRFGRFLGASLLLLVVGLLHPGTNLPAGIAQCIFQLAIAAPMFWVGAVVQNRDRLMRLVWLVFVANAISAGIGALQVYYPGVFMPPEFSTLALTLNPDVVTSLTYIGADGQEIIRPPGLTDYPGGASVAGMTAGLLGVVLAFQPGLSNRWRFVSLALSAVGLLTLYLTQVRSLLMVMVVGLALLCALLVKQRRVAAGAGLIVLTAALVTGAFVWATAIGGESVAARFLGLLESGPIASYQESRGGFVTHTLRDLALEHPLGAGVGRWGMMYIHFGDRGATSPPIHVEIQMTGWLLDGGIPMWICYGGAIILALLFVYRVAVRSPDPLVAYAASIILTVSFIVVAQSLAGPSFNTSLGIQFWMLISAVYGVARADVLKSRRPRQAMEAVPREVGK